MMPWKHVFNSQVKVAWTAAAHIQIQESGTQQTFT